MATTQSDTRNRSFTLGGHLISAQLDVLSPIRSFDLRVARSETELFRYRGLDGLLISNQLEPLNKLGSNHANLRNSFRLPEHVNFYECNQIVLIRPTQFDMLRAMWVVTAAVTIQRYWRGHRERTLGSADLDFTRWKLNADIQATKIQRAFRQYKEKLEKERESVIAETMKARRIAATKIQLVWRARQVVRLLEKDRLIEVVRRSREIAAVEIQRHYRGYKTRQILDLENEFWIIKWVWDKPGRVVECFGDFTIPAWTRRILLEWNNFYRLVEQKVVDDRASSCLADVTQHMCHEQQDEKNINLQLMGIGVVMESLRVYQSDGAGHYNNVRVVTGPNKFSKYQDIRNKIKLSEQRLQVDHMIEEKQPIERDDAPPEKSSTGERSSIGESYIDHIKGNREESRLFNTCGETRAAAAAVPCCFITNRFATNDIRRKSWSRKTIKLKNEELPWDFKRSSSVLIDQSVNAVTWRWGQKTLQNLKNDRANMIISKRKSLKEFLQQTPLCRDWMLARERTNACHKLFETTNATMVVDDTAQSL